MSNKNHNSSKKRSLYINTFRVIASLALLYIAYTYFYSDIRFSELLDTSTYLLTPKSIFLLICIIILMPVNWILEAAKWREGLKPSKILSRKQSFTAVFQGITFGILTPARIGEYGGRILYLKPEDRVAGVLSTFICSLYQNIINIFFASLFLLFTAQSIFINVVNSYLYIVLGIIVCAGTVLVLKFLPFILEKLSENSFINKKLPNFKNAGFQLKRIHKKKVFAYSFLRYLTYCFQYFLIFQIFPISLSWIETGIAISIIYGIQTILPLTPLLQVGLRGSIALFVISPPENQKDTVIIASYCLWLINLLIPSILGAIIMLFQRVTEK